MSQDKTMDKILQEKFQKLMAKKQEEKEKNLSTPINQPVTAPNNQPDPTAPINQSVTAPTNPPAKRSGQNKGSGAGPKKKDKTDSQYQEQIKNLEQEIKKLKEDQANNEAITGLTNEVERLKKLLEETTSTNTQTPKVDPVLPQGPIPTGPMPTQSNEQVILEAIQSTTPGTQEITLSEVFNQEKIEQLYFLHEELLAPDEWEEELKNNPMTKEEALGLLQRAKEIIASNDARYVMLLYLVLQEFTRKKEPVCLSELKKILFGSSLPTMVLKLANTTNVKLARRDLLHDLILVRQIQEYPMVIQEHLAKKYRGSAIYFVEPTRELYKMFLIIHQYYKPENIQGRIAQIKPVDRGTILVKYKVLKYMVEHPDEIFTTSVDQWNSISSTQARIERKKLVMEGIIKIEVELHTGYKPGIYYSLVDYEAVARHIQELSS